MPGHLRRGHRFAVLLLAAGLVACARGEEPAASERIFVALGGETFTLEVAADPATRRRGLSGRAGVARNGGMLFVLPRPEPLAMVMRDCPVPLDVAFLDAGGRVLAIHEMKPEPPRRPDETPFEYERRLPPYGSPAPAHFAIETAGGRLAQVGLAVGDRVRLDAPALIRSAR